MTLLHLLSNETMQNLLPMVALKPNWVIQVASRGEKFAEKAQHIQKAYKKLREIQPDLPLVEFIMPAVQLESDTPSIDESYHRIDELANQYPDLCVNFTGATKPMSIGAYLVAKYRRLPSYYCDTQAGYNLPGRTGENEQEIAITPLFDLLDVEVILEAY